MVVPRTSNTQSLQSAIGIRKQHLTGCCFLLEEERKRTMARKKAAEERRITGTVTGGTLNIRDKAGLDGGIVGTLEDGAKIEVIKDEGDWLRIEGGFVMARWVELDG